MLLPIQVTNLLIKSKQLTNHYRIRRNVFLIDREIEVNYKNNIS